MRPVVKMFDRRVFPMRAIIRSSRFEVLLKRAARGAHLKPSRLLGIFTAGIIFFSAGSVQAQLIDVNFNNTGSPMSRRGGSWNGGRPVEWNQRHQRQRNSPDERRRQASAVTMTFTAGGDYYVNASTPFAATPYNNLMDCYLYTGSAAPDHHAFGYCHKLNLQPDSV